MLKIRKVISLIKCIMSIIVSFTLSFVSIIDIRYGIISMYSGFSTYWIDVTFAFISFILFLIEFVKLLKLSFKSGNSNYLLLFSNDGDVEVSDTAIKNLISREISKIGYIIEHSTKVKIKNDKEESYKVLVDLDCGLDENLENEINEEKVDLYKYIQDNIHIAIENFLGDKIDRINIKFYYTKKKNLTNKKYFNEKNKRVN